MTQRVRRSHYAVRKPKLALFFLLCVFLFGCNGAITIWSQDSISPDGQWRAEARTDQYSGPGNAALLTHVQLKPTKGRKDPIEVLVLMQNTRSIELKMIWLSASHLEITFKQPAVIDFQAVKCAGIQITVRDLSDSTSDSSPVG